MIIKLIKAFFVKVTGFIAKKITFFILKKKVKNIFKKGK